MNSNRKGLDHYLFQQESNAPLELFRIAFGFLMLAEAWGAIATGWVTETFVDVNYTFPFFGFGWTQFMLGTPMYFFFIVMGIFAIGVMLGYKYKWSILGLAILWSLSYLMQKTHYNNHYYLVMLVCWIFAFLPVAKRFSIDSRRNPEIYANVIPSWPRFLLIGLIAVVYFFAAINKIYPDWLKAMPLEIWMANKAHYPIIGGFLQKEWIPMVMAQSGIWFDLLIVPALLWKRTRWLAVFASVGFHLFNSAVFQIGIFPYFAMAFIVFFFPPHQIEKLVTKGKSFDIKPYQNSLKSRSYIKLGFIGFLAVMLILPVRHHFIPDDVLWTEAGHRLSWRMMLRTKAGIAHFHVIADGEKHTISTRQRLARHQINDAATKPDVMYTFSRYLEKEFLEKGYSDIEVYVDARISVNGREFKQFTDSEFDLLSTRWNYFGNQEWVLPRPW